MLLGVAQTCKWQTRAHDLRAVQLRVIQASLLVLLQKSLSLLEIIVNEFRRWSIGLRIYVWWSLVVCRSKRVLSAEIERMRLFKLVLDHFLEVRLWIDQGSDFIIKHSFVLAMLPWSRFHRGFVNWISGDEIQILFFLAIRFSGLLICLLWFGISRYLRGLGTRTSTSWTRFGINWPPVLLYLRWNEAQERLVQILAFKLLFFFMNLSITFLFLGIVFILIVNQSLLLCLILLWFVSITFRPTVWAIGSVTERELL